MIAYSLGYHEVQPGISGACDF